MLKLKPALAWLEVFEPASRVEPDFSPHEPSVHSRAELKLNSAWLNKNSSQAGLTRLPGLREHKSVYIYI